MSDENLRLGVFAIGLFGFSSLGVLLPFRNVFNKQILLRLTSNLTLALLNVVLVKLVFPSGLAILASQDAHEGLFQSIESPILVFFLSLLLLDLVIYWQHRIFHHIPFFWRFHRVHHSDIEFDTTTGLRFHPVEIVFSLAIKASIIVLFGIPARAVLAFEILLNFSSLFNHSNFSLPRWVESLLRSILVTPDMHRVHHSVIMDETNSNFGFCLSIWDRLFKSYCSRTKENPKDMPIGLLEFRSNDEQKVFSLLAQPLRQLKS